MSSTFIIACATPLLPPSPLVVWQCGGRSAIGARSRLLRADPTQNQQNQLSSLNSLNSQSQENLLGQHSQPSQPSQSSPQQSPSQSPQQQPQVTPTATRPRNTSHLPLANLIYRPASPSQNLHGALNPASPAQSLGSNGGGIIYRDDRDDPPPDIITVSHRNTPPQTQSPSQQSPSQQQSSLQQQQQQLLQHQQQQHQQQQQQQHQQQQHQQHQQHQAQQGRRGLPPNMPDQELDSAPTQGITISPTGSFRQRKARNDSAGSADFVIPEVGPMLGKESPTTGRRSEDRPGSSGRRDQREKDKERERSEKGDTPRRSGESARRPLPQSFDSTGTIKPMSNPAVNHSSSDLLGSTGVSQTRDSPTHDQGVNSRKHTVDSVDSILPSNGEPGGWAYESETSPQGPPPRNSSESWRENDRDRDRGGRQTNQNYNNSRFSPERIPFTEDADRDEDAVAPILDHGIVRNGSSGSLNKVSPPVRAPSLLPHALSNLNLYPVQPQQPTRKRDLPGIPAQQASQSQQQAQQTHGHGLYSHTNQSIIPVPKSQHAQIIQNQNWIRRPSSPLAREPVVAGELHTLVPSRAPSLTL